MNFFLLRPGVFPIFGTPSVRIQNETKTMLRGRCIAAWALVCGQISESILIFNFFMTANLTTKNDFGYTTKHFAVSFS